MRTALCLVALTLAACNTVFGIDETRPLPDGGIDSDDDGWVDAFDNCEMAPNHGQADADADGIGDACDGCFACEPCATPMHHDEDADRIDDGCDNCPAGSNADQTNTDGDDLGDACDLSPSAQRRIFFDGFGSISPDWFAIGGTWVVDNDSAVSIDAPQGFLLGLVHTKVRITDVPYRVDLGVDPVAFGDGQTQIDARVLEITSAVEYRICSYVYDAGIDPGPLTISLRHDGSGVSCLVDGQSPAPRGTAMTFPLLPAFTMAHRSSVQFIDVIQ